MGNLFNQAEREKRTNIKNTDLMMLAIVFKLLGQG